MRPACTRAREGLPACYTHALHGEQRGAGAAGRHPERGEKIVTPVPDMLDRCRSARPRPTSSLRLVTNVVSATPVRAPRGTFRVLKTLR